MASAPLVQSLPSAVPGVRRLLVRDEHARLVEVLELPAGRAAEVPTGGVFAPCAVEDGRLLLGRPLARRLVEALPGPLAALGLLARVLGDLERVHERGGAHGGLALEGWGFDAQGWFRIRPVLHVPPPPGPRRASDMEAFGVIAAALAPAEALEAAGIARARLWLRGLGVDAPRVNFRDARSARQALAAVAAGAPLDAALDAWAEANAARVPRAEEFRVSPVVDETGERAPDPRAAAPLRAATDLRARLDRDLERSRAERYHQERAAAEARVEAERARLERERRAAEAGRERAAREREAVLEASRARRRADDAGRRRAAEARIAELEAQVRREAGAGGPGIGGPRAEEEPRPAVARVFGAAAAAVPEALEALEALEARDDELLDATVADEGLVAQALPVDDIQPGDDRAAARVIWLDGGDARLDEVVEIGGVGSGEAEEEIGGVVEAAGEGGGVGGGAAEAVEPAEEIVPDAPVEPAEDTEEAQRIVADAVRVEGERVAAEAARAEAIRVATEAARIEAERVEAARIAAEAARFEAARVEAERLAAEAARIEAERVEAERIAAAEAERIAAESEAERIAAAIEAERIEAERIATAIEAERIEDTRRRTEAARREAEQIEAERLAAERAAAERAAAEQIEAERLAAERLELQRIAAEVARLEAERIEAQRLSAEAARLEAERARAEAARVAEEEARIEAERIAQAAWHAELARLEAAERAAAAERLEAERAAEVERAAERARAEVEHARVEAERIAAEAARPEAARLEAARLEAARLEAERIEATRIEAARIEAARIEAEAARIEAEAARSAPAPTPELEPEPTPEHVTRLPAGPRWAAAAPVTGDTTREHELGPGKWTAPGRSAADPLADLPPRETLDDGPHSDGPAAAPRWTGAVGITGTSAREGEKGPGKWTASGRDVEALLAGLPTGPTRPLDLSAEPPRRSGRLVIVGLLVVAAIVTVVVLAT